MQSYIVVSLMPIPPSSREEKGSEILIEHFLRPASILIVEQTLPYVTCDVLFPCTVLYTPITSKCSSLSL